MKYYFLLQELVSRILGKVRIGFKVIAGDCEDIEVAVEANTILGTTLPLPLVGSGFTTELSKTYEVGTTVSFEEEFTGELIKDEAERVSAEGVGVGTLTDGIYGLGALGRSLATVHAGIGLGKSEIGLGTAHKEEIGVDILTVVGRTATGVVVAVLCTADTTGKFARSLYACRTVDAKEECTVITGCSKDFLGVQAFGSCGIALTEELFDELGTATVSGPVFRSSKYAHVGLCGRSEEKERGTPAGSSGTVLKQRKHGFSGCGSFAIVAHEKHLIGTIAIHTLGVELVGTIHDKLGILLRFLPLCLSGIDLGIQVKTCKKQVGSIAVCTAIAFITGLASCRLEHILTHSKEFTLDDFMAMTRMQFAKNSENNYAVAFCGLNAHQRIQAFAYNTSVHNGSIKFEEVTEMGINVSRWHDSLGTLEIVYDPTLDDIGREDDIAIIDIQNAVRYYKRNEKQEKQDMKTSGEHREAERTIISMIDCIGLKGYNAVLVTPASKLADALKLGGVSNIIEPIGADVNSTSGLDQSKMYYLGHAVGSFPAGVIIKYNGSAWVEFDGNLSAA